MSSETRQEARTRYTMRRFELVVRQNVQLTEENANLKKDLVRCNTTIDTLTTYQEDIEEEMSKRGLLHDFYDCRRVWPAVLDALMEARRVAEAALHELGANVPRWVRDQQMREAALACEGTED